MERADVDFPIADQFPIFPPYCFNQTRSMVFIMENNSFFPGSPCIDACFFFRTFIFYYFFFSIKIARNRSNRCLHVRYNVLYNNSLPWFRSISKKIPSSSPSPLILPKFADSLFVFLSSFPPRWTKFQAVLLTRSSDSKREKRIPHCIPLR